MLVRNSKLRRYAGLFLLATPGLATVNPSTANPVDGVPVHRSADFREPSVPPLNDPGVRVKGGGVCSDQYPLSGTEAMCACAADTAEIELLGVAGLRSARFTASFTGFMAATTDDQLLMDGRCTVPMTITGHSTSASSPMGVITVDHDFDRPAPLSLLQEESPGTGFPATQEMYVNILVTIEALPGMTLRNVSVGTLRSTSQFSFPPRNDVYTLTEPMDLEVASGPLQGTVVARIISYSALINPDPVPAVSQWGAVVMALVFLTVGTVMFGRRRRGAAA